MSALHFACSFDIQPKNTDDCWGTLLKTVRKWISERPCPQRNNDFWKAWFFRGGEWKSDKDSRIRVLTKACYGNDSSHNADCWAVEYEHPCEDYPECRIWCTQIGIRQFGESQFRFNLRLLYKIRPGYIGPHPEVPLPSSPGLVKKLLSSGFWECTAGPQELTLTPHVLRVGQGKYFEELLASKDRTCPVVLISHRYPDCGYVLDPKELSQLLAGTSIVFQSDNSEVDKELEYVLGRRFSCWNGMIRIYVPNLDFARKGDYRRHRFILPKDVHSWGIDKAREIIVTGVARRNQHPKGIVAPHDVEKVSRKRRLRELYAKENTVTENEWIQELEKDNDELVQAKNRLETENITLLERIDSLTDDIQRLKSEKQALKGQLRNAGGTRNRGTLLSLNGNLCELPKSLSEVIEIIQSIHSECITFTERAIRSAKETHFADVHVAWKALWAMATTLYEVLFKEEGGDKENLFQNRCGVELAMTEGKLTKRDAKLMALRKDRFEEEEIDITPHVKFDDDTTRAYFCPFRKNEINLIVVGFIGHLDTAGTRRRK